MKEFGHVHVGLWMTSPEETEIMIRSLDERLRNISIDDPDRPKLEEWRRQAMNFTNKSRNQEWAGWQSKENK